MTLKKCPSCGHQHDSADIVCPYCKYSYSDKRFVCSNCGAYLQPMDKVCYVCGQVAPPIESQVPEPEIIDDVTEDVSESQQDISIDTDTLDTYEDIDKNSVEKVSSKSKNKPKKKSKKVAVICAIVVVLVALIGAGVCVCHLNGWLPKEKEDEQVNMTLYFDKPFAGQNLLDSEGMVYNWTGDVDINYTEDGQTVKKACKMTLEYDSIWYCQVPYNAKNVFFSQSTLDTVRTVAIPEVIGDNIYYVNDIVFNNRMQLPIGCCPLSEFDNFGINYMQATFAEATTEATIEETTSSDENTQESSDSETEAETQTETEGENTAEYDISFPEQWQENMTVIKNGNCTSYYEKYNYENYQCGMLMAVYVFEANDISYSEMNADKIITADDGRKIVVITPTDIQFADSDNEAIQQYTSLSQYTGQVVDSIQAK